MATSRSALRVGSRLGKYRLDRRLGRGAFAEVWRARDTIERRNVALKVIDAPAVRDHGRNGIEREARIAARLDHANIVSTRNADWIDGRFVIATDLARRSLGSYRGAYRSAAVALRVLGHIVDGLAHAHSRRVMHLDLKPENILIFADGRAALADFGTSRLVPHATRTYTEAGTLGYLAPEQAYGKPHFTSDVFSVGLIAYELITGKLPSWPFDWPPGPEHARFEARVPEPLQAVIRRAASFQPERRFADAIEMQRAFDRARQRADRELARVRRPRRRRQPEPPSPLAIEADLFRRRFAKSLEMGFVCHHCAGPIAESMTHCPWCGQSDHSFSEVSSYPLVCPECERGVMPEWRNCPWCYAGRLEGNGHPARPDPHAARSCSRRGCDGELRQFMRYCPSCKQKPRRVWSHTELADRCPRCRWPVNRQSWRFCPWCGRREPKAGTFVRGRNGAGSTRAPRSR